MAGITSGQAGFAASVLKAIGAPATPQNIAGFVGWSKAEGGDNWQRNNPLNTTESLGSTGSINSVGVKRYPDANAGVAATVKTLQNGNYGGIVNAFKSNNVHGLAGAIGASPWGTSGSLAAQTIAQTLGQPVPSVRSLSAPATAGPAAGASQAITSFDQAAFDKAQQAAIAGKFLADSANSGSMWQTGPKSPVPAGASLFGPGLLTTVAPNKADYTTTTPAQTGPVAHSALQDLAGGTNLSTHPAVKQAADKILNMAVAAIGGPYSQAAHATAFTQSAAQLRKTGTDCSGFVSWLMGPDGLGIWKNALATPQIPSAPGIQKGPGQAITIYNNPLPGNSGHVFIQIAGRFFQSAGGGTGIQAISNSAAQGMIKNGDNGAPYTALHPAGY